MFNNIRRGGGAVRRSIWNREKRRRDGGWEQSEGVNGKKKRGEGGGGVEL